MALPEACPPPEQQEAERQCQVLSAADGPFAPCHAAVPPLPYLESCTQDLCATGGSPAQLCHVLRSYAAACQAAGVALEGWEAETACGESRPASALSMGSFGQPPPPGLGLGAPPLLQHSRRLLGFSCAWVGLPVGRGRKPHACRRKTFLR